MQYAQTHGVRLSKKRRFFDKGVCGLTAAHAPSAQGGRAHVCRPRVFSQPHMSPEKMIGFFFLPPGGETLRGFGIADPPMSLCMCTDPWGHFMLFMPCAPSRGRRARRFGSVHDERVAGRSPAMQWAMSWPGVALQVALEPDARRRPQYTLFSMTSAWRRRSSRGSAVTAGAAAGR